MIIVIMGLPSFLTTFNLLESKTTKNFYLRSVTIEMERLWRRKNNSEPSGIQ